MIAGPKPSLTPGIELVTHYSAVPLFGAIAPWNFPVILSHIDAVPALMAGSAALVKPSEVTPRFVEPMRAVLAAMPDLPLAYVMGGAEVGQALIEEVDYVCFTGSTATGRKGGRGGGAAAHPGQSRIGRQGSDDRHRHRRSGLGRAGGAAIRDRRDRAGVPVDRAHLCRPRDRRTLPRRAGGGRQGGGADHPDPARGHIGPFIFPAQADKVQVQIDAAVAAGARVLAGGTVERLGGGAYLRPTVLIDVTHDMAVMREETFGPVLPVTLFDTSEEAVALANDSAYGLSAAVLAGSLEEAEAIAPLLDAGAVSLAGRGAHLDGRRCHQPVAQRAAGWGRAGWAIPG